MADYRANIARAAGGVMQPGEPVLAAVRALPKTSPVGLLGGLIVHSILVSEERRRLEGLGFPAATSMVLAATDRRLLVFQTPSFGRRPKFRGEVPYSWFRSASAERRGLNASLRFFLEPRGELALTAYRRDPLEEFADALTRAIEAWWRTAPAMSAAPPSLPAIPPPPPPPR